MVGIVTYILYLISAVLITVTIHELGHLLASLLCKVKVSAFSIGFGKPYIHKKIFGIDFRLSPILLGGYVKITGEYKKTPNGFLIQPYWKKVLILISGILMNFILISIIYLFVYKSIIKGIVIDWNWIKVIFLKDYVNVNKFMQLANTNLFLTQLTVINLFSGIFNLIPFPALDGGMLWLVLLDKKIKNFGKFLKSITQLGFWILMVLQIILFWYIFSK